MIAPYSRVVCLGEVSLWGKQFIQTLVDKHVIEADFQPSINKYLDDLKTTRPQIVFVENSPESRHWIMSLRESGRRFYILWFGKKFPKEDLSFAIEHRIYSVFESLMPEDKSVAKGIVAVSHLADHEDKFEVIVRSLKSILLQAEGDLAPSLMGELKAAIGKVAEYGRQNEFSLESIAPSTQDAINLMIPRTEDLADALHTVESLERTGVLWVRGNQAMQEAKIEFLHGKIVSAASGEVHGLKAVYRAFLWDSPRFLFTRREPDEYSMGEEIKTGMNHICAEGIDYKARFEKIRKDIPRSDLVLELDPSYLHAGGRLAPDQFSALSSIVEFGKVAQVLDYNPLPDAALYETLIELRKHKMVKVAT